MTNVTCRHCKMSVDPGADHHCKQMQQAGLPSMRAPNAGTASDDDCFHISAAVGYATGDSLVGTLVGGDAVGAALGAAAHNDTNDDNDLKADHDADDTDDDDDSDDD